MAEALRVLLIEDDEQDAELVKIELERGGFDVQSTRVDTEEALRRALTEHPWDLILSDFAMPRFDGLKAFDVFRGMGLDTPFIFVSGALGEERAVAAMRAGARDYLLKGDLARLNAAVRRELDEASNRRRLKQSQVQAGRERTRLRAALDATGAGLFELSIPEGSDTFVSDRWADIIGYSPTELLGNGPVLDWWFAQLSPEDVPAWRRAFERFIAGELPILHADVRVRHHKGHWIDVSSYAIATSRDEQQRAERVVLVLMDVSATRQLEAKYQQAQRLEAVGKLAGGVAHDFNNLLTAIISYAGFLRDDMLPSDRRRDDVREILAAADRAAGLTRQLLLFSRQQPAELRPIDVGAVVQNIRGLLARTIGEDIELNTNELNQPEVVLASATQLDQIVLNLAVNSRDAMPDGGSLSIRVERTELELDQATTLDVEPGTYVQIVVSDSGIGMDDKTLERIFEPFFTTKGPTEGTGLGLATTYGFTKQLGGGIDVESTPGEGTTFRVLLPHFAGKLPTGGQRTAGSNSPQGTETILVVEDETALRRIAERALKRCGYTVLLAEDGPRAMELLATHKETIELVFSDVVLTRGNGFELADMIRKESPNLPVLLTSGYTDQRAVREGTDFEIFWKPYTPSDLVRRIRACLDGGSRRGDRAEEPADGVRRVLVVDDQYHVRRALRRMLEGGGYNVTAVASAAAARKCLTGPSEFHAVLTDLHLDDASGMELIRWIEGTIPALANRCLVLTGSAYFDSDAEIAGDRSVPVIAKPIVIAELLEAVGRLVNGSE